MLFEFDMLYIDEKIINGWKIMSRINIVIVRAIYISLKPSAAIG